MFPDFRRTEYIAYSLLVRPLPVEPLLQHIPTIQKRCEPINETLFSSFRGQIILELNCEESASNPRRVSSSRRTQIIRPGFRPDLGSNKTTSLSGPCLRHCTANQRIRCDLPHPAIPSITQNMCTRSRTNALNKVS